MKNININMPDYIRVATIVKGVLLESEKELKEIRKSHPEYWLCWVYRPVTKIINLSPDNYWFIWGEHTHDHEPGFQPPRKVWDEMDAGAWTSSGVTYECLRMDRVVRDMRLCRYEPEPFSEIYANRRLETLSLQMQDDGEDPYDMQNLTDMAIDEEVEEELTARAKELVALSTAGPLWSWEYRGSSYGVAIYDREQRRHG